MDYLVTLRRDGPAYDLDKAAESQSGWPEHAAYMDGLVAGGMVRLGGPLSDQRRVVLAVVADSPDEVRKRLGLDPWAGTHLTVTSIEEWHLRLGARP